MNSTEPEGQTDVHSEGDGELKDGDEWSEEEKPVFTGGLRRSKRQVSCQTASMSLFLQTHTSTCTHRGPARNMSYIACIAASVTTRETSELRYANTLHILQRRLSDDFHSHADSLSQLSC